MISILLFTFEIIAPIFLLILLGSLLKRTSLINDIFVRQLSNFVFNISLPALVFIKLSNVKIEQTFDITLISSSIVLVLMFFIVSWVVAAVLTKKPEDQGSFIQGSFRSNYAIVGLAIILDMFGEESLGKAALLLAFIMPLYNILAVIALTVPFHRDKENKFKVMFKEVLTNPLIVAAIVSVFFSMFELSVWTPIEKTLEYLAVIALPLALIGIGATLEFERIRKASMLAFSSTFLKIVLFPLIAILVGIALDLSNNDMGIFFVLFATPTAIASFVMAEAMNCNSKLAGDIIAISTVLSVFTITIGLVVLKYFGYI
ncbi:MAG: AEC family transporter [Bacteroidota bacterium]